MTDDRRYSDEEVAEIFDRAADTHAKGITGGSAPAPSDQHGMSLAELEEIGDEVGIPRALVRSAAVSLDRQSADDPTASRRVLGATVGVGKVVHLPRNLTDKEWGALVVDLRDTFNAKGAVRHDGPFRQWTQGNLQALLEPLEDGARLRLRTTKGSALAAMSSGGALAALGAFTALVASGPNDLVGAAVIGIGGAALHLGARFLLPAWRRTRSGQMDEIIARLTAKIETRSTKAE